MANRNIIRIARGTKGRINQLFTNGDLELYEIVYATDTPAIGIVRDDKVEWFDTKENTIGDVDFSDYIKKVNNKTPDGNGAITLTLDDVSDGTTRKLANFVTATDVDNAISVALGSVMKYKGSVANMTALNALTGMVIGDFYNVADSGINYAWDGSAWDKVGGVTVIPVFTGATSNADGVEGLVKKPLIADRTKYLKGDGTWDTPPNTVYTLPLASDSTRGGVKVGYAENGKKYAVKLDSEKAYVEVNWTDTDTKNTAGSNNNIGKKMYLIGAEVQGANPQTYSNVNIYIGADNKLYVDDSAVLTSHQSLVAYFKKDGSVKATGDFDLDGNNILNVELDGGDL